MKILCLVVLVGVFLIFSYAIVQGSNSSIGRSSYPYFHPEPTMRSSVPIDFEIDHYQIGAEHIDETYSVQGSSDYPGLVIHRVTADSKIYPTHQRFGDRDTKIAEKPLGTAFDENILTLTDLRYSGLFVRHSYQYYWGFDCGWTEFQYLLDTLAALNYRIENIDTYGQSSYLYAGNWIGDLQGWAWVLDYTSSSDFINALNTWPGIGIRVADMEIHPFSNQLYYGAVGIQDSYGWAWVLNYTWSSFEPWAQSQQGVGRRIIDIDVYRDPGSGELRYAGVAQANTESYSWAWAVNLNWSTFDSLHTYYESQGLRLIDYEVYSLDGQVYYAGAWVGDGRAHGWALNYTSQLDFVDRIDFLRDNNSIYPFQFNVWDADELVSVEVEQKPVTANDALYQNSPNPFTPSTTIRYSIKRPNLVRLLIHDGAGRLVRTLANREHSPGKYSVVWDGRNKNGEMVASGTYFYTLKVGNGASISRKMIMIK